MLKYLWLLLSGFLMYWSTSIVFNAMVTDNRTVSILGAVTAIVLNIVALGVAGIVF
jgi:cytochrome c oxidase assembly factor CtaG